MKLIFGLLIVYISSAHGYWFSSKSGPEWNSVRTTWGPNPLSSQYFVRQPLTVEDAKKSGFVQISSGCQGKFLGQRFMQGKDVGLVLIYDNKGFIAGTQMAIPLSLITEKYYRFSQQKMFNRDTIGGIDVYILTAYFVDPKTICQSDQLTTPRVNGSIGTGLWLQNGPDPIQDSFSSPISQSDVNQTKWVEGACFPSMGVHYWYENRLDADCGMFFPAFLLYNKGTLTGFGWATAGKYTHSTHCEYPPLAALQAFLKPVPTCMPGFFQETGGFTTMHVYFNFEPWNIVC